MIGHFLLSLTPEQEDRVLLEPFEPYTQKDVERCVVDVAFDFPAGYTSDTNAGPNSDETIGCAYDSLAKRFGVARVNTAIRDRVLTNKLWRAKTPAEAFAVVTAFPSETVCINPN